MTVVIGIYLRVSFPIKKMRKNTVKRCKNLHRFCGIFLLLISTPVTSVDQFRIQIHQIDYLDWHLQDVSFQLNLTTKNNQTFEISAKKITSDQIGKLADLNISCPLNEIPVTTNIAKLTCTDGTFQIMHSLLGKIQGNINFSAQTDGQKISLNVDQLKTAAGQLQFEINKNENSWQLLANSTQINLAKLRGLINPFYELPNVISDEAGRVSLRVSASGREREVEQIDIDLVGKDIFFNGKSVAENLDAQLKLKLRKKASGWDINKSLKLTKGLLYIEPGFKIGNVNPGFLIEAGIIKEKPVQLDFSGEWSANEININSLNYSHPEVLEITAFGQILLNQEKVLSNLNVNLKSPTLKKVFPIYMQPLLLGSGLDNLEIVGQVDLNLVFTNDSISDFHLKLNKVYADDQQDRFLVSGLDGDIRLNSDPQPADSSMHWNGGSIYKVNIGPGEFNLRSKGRSMWLRKKVIVPIFDGGLEIEKLIMNELGLEDYAIHLDASLTPITLSEFTESMGWPLMAGNVSGEIPGLSYYKGDLTLDGALHVNVFDGDIAIKQLKIEQLFGLVPSLFAHIEIDELDLGTLTETFEFGKITGKLSGKIKDLQLQDWQPVYFDAHIATPEDDKSKHRISQRAIDNITSIGGGSSASSFVQRRILGIFEDFPYSKIGITCLLRNNICHMGGVAKAKDGYYIVKPGILPPWLEIIGFNDTVDWQEMIERLKSLKDAESPIVE